MPPKTNPTVARKTYRNTTPGGGQSEVRVQIRGNGDTVIYAKVTGSDGSTKLFMQLVTDSSGKPVHVDIKKFVP